MWMIDKRIQVICDELKNLVTVQRFDVEGISCKEGQYFRPEEADAAPGSWQSFYPGQTKWYGPDQHYWFRACYTVPEELAGKTLRLCVKTQIEEEDDAKNPQFLLFVNGNVTQGLDMNHRTVQLTAGARPSESWQLDLQAYTGTLHTQFDLILQMLQIDPLIEKLYYDLLVPLEAFPRMGEEDRNRMQLTQVLDEAVNLLDLRIPYSEDFYESVRRADAYLQKALYTDLAGWDEVKATCIGHTHIDVAWWWTVDQTKEKAARSFSTVLKLMDEYPDYHFMSSQPQLYEFVKERYPRLYEQIKARVKEGRWEPEGGMWLEADTNLTSGESLVRQFLYGKRFFREEFGVDSKILWLPDAFGYSGALPQIMKKCGVDYFMTTKLSWNQLDQMPYDTFLWKGIDGSEVFTHMITTLGVGQDPSDFFTTYNGMLHPDAIMGGWERYQNKDINNDILIAYGYGDGGGGPTREMLETSKRMETGIRGIPKVRQESAGVYFEELSERVKEDPRLPAWEGELYFEYHRGTYTSMARNKRSNRKSEFLMMDLELFSVLGALSGVPVEKERLDALWKKILLNQFHDILPGTAIHEVYEKTKEEYDWIGREAGGMLRERMQALAGSGAYVTLFNTLGFLRGDPVRLQGLDRRAAALTDEEGTVLPLQWIGDEAVAFVPDLPSKGWRSYQVVRGPEETAPAQNTPFTLKGNQLETPFYRITFDQTGCFASLYDKENDREVLQAKEKGNLFRMYEDKPANYDNWDIDVYYTEKSWDVTDLTRMEWIALGPVCAVLELERHISRSLIRQKIYFYADSRRIDFETYVDWKEHQHLLKVLFPVDVHTDEASFDIQFGNVTRKVHTNTSWDRARFESCAQKWIDLSEGHYGVSLLNDCKYGHSVRDSVIGLTLIKSGTVPNPVADQEEHFFTYALYPHAGSLHSCDTIRQGYCLNAPVLVQKESARMAADSFMKVDQKNVIAETVKPAEDGDGVILRLYECENAQTAAEVTFGMGLTLQSLQECSLLEEPLGEPLEHEENGFTFRIRPFEIRTFRVRFT